jgi:hypothetical protein
MTAALINKQTLKQVFEPGGLSFRQHGRSGMSSGHNLIDVPGHTRRQELIERRSQKGVALPDRRWPLGPLLGHLARANFAAAIGNQECPLLDVMRQCHGTGTIVAT